MSSSFSSHNHHHRHDDVKNQQQQQPSKRVVLGQVSQNRQRTMVILDDDESHSLILNKDKRNQNNNNNNKNTSSSSTTATKKETAATTTNEIINLIEGTSAKDPINLTQNENDPVLTDAAELSQLFSNKLTLTPNNGDVTALTTTTAPTTTSNIMTDVKDVTGEMMTVDWQKEHKQMDKMFENQVAKQLENLPPFERPFGLKDHIQLFDYQQQGVSWLLQQEVDAPPNPFNKQRHLKDGSIANYDYLTRHRLLRPHPPVKGSILADDMGLGKTLQTLTLLLSNPPTNKLRNELDDHHARTQTSRTVCTVIVCPKSVIGNWITQAQEFVQPGVLNMVVYQGTPAQRSAIIQKVMDNKVDVLLSTYETITAEYNRVILSGQTSTTKTNGKEFRTVHDVQFHRIVLDEAQQIRNHKSKTYAAIESVAQQSEYRLALSGTPFVNKPEDVMSLLSFIGLHPLGDPTVFKEFVSDPIKVRKRAGLTRLRLACSYVVLRRTKGIVDNGMVDKTIHINSVDFPRDSIHKQVYDSLYCACRVALTASLRGSVPTIPTNDKNHGNGSGVSASTHRAMFALLMRVRQSCASGALVSNPHYQVAFTLMKNLYNGDGTPKELSSDDGERMLHILQNANGSGDDTRVDVGGDRSPKTNALLSLIGQMQPDEKGVIFSQWTSMLDLIEKALVNAGYQFSRIDGSMSTDERTASLQRITNNDDCRFILCSLKAAGVGINLTRANVCFMMDPWWNESIELQAIDRVHRVGQKRPVRIYRMIMKDSIEERMLKVQKAKSTLGKGTLKKLTKAEEKIAKLTGLKDLFEIEDTDLPNGSNGTGSSLDDWMDL